MEVNGQTFAKGVSGQTVTVPRFGEAVLAVDAVSNLASVLRQISELSKGGREGIDYRIHGRLATGNFGSVPFESKGELQPAAAAGRAARLTRRYLSCRGPFSSAGFGPEREWGRAYCPSCWP
ncbi:MAG: LEA type 2 family protein [Comamonadaceae bacterium]|nr:LEA type 2 family protein [Comamonadaceae bacterium]